MGDRFLIWGGGGHGRVVADLVRVLGHEVLGYVDRDPAKRGRPAEPGGALVMWDEDVLMQVIESERGYPAPVQSAAVAIGDNALRLRCLRRLDGLAVPSLLHPSAVVSPSATIGRGSVVSANVVVKAAAQIGEGVILNSASVVEHDCVLDDGVHLSPGAILGGGVTVGERTWIGLGASIIHGVHIGKNVMVGAGAVVIRDVPDEVTVVGNPATLIQRRQGG